MRARSRRQIAVWIGIAIAILSPAFSFAIGPPWNPEFVRSTVQGSDLVVRGLIDSVHVETAPYDGRQYPSTFIRLRVFNVIKGVWSRPRIETLLLGTRGLGTEGVTYDYVTGEEVILCLQFDKNTRGGLYRFYVDGQSYVNRNGRWQTRDGNAVSIDDIRAAVRETDPEVMARDADAVVTGTVQSVERRTLNLDGSSTAGDDRTRMDKATADYVQVVATEGIKGMSSGDTLLVRVLRRGRQLDWWAPMPDLQAGKSYLMFLKWDGTGYFPSRGFNGFLEVRGDQLILNDHVLYRLTRQQITDEVRKALGP